MNFAIIEFQEVAPGFSTRILDPFRLAKRDWGVWSCKKGG
jgi:hypothetical protein